MTPAAKVGLPPPKIICFLTPEEFGRRGQFYFGLSAFEGFEFTDAFTGQRDTVSSVYDAVEDGVCHCGVTDGVVPVQFGQLGGDFAPDGDRGKKKKPLKINDFKRFSSV